MADKPISSPGLPQQRQPSTTFERVLEQTNTTALPSNHFTTTSQPSSFSSITHAVRKENNTLAPIGSSTTMVMEPKKKPFDISSLMSPPEVVPYDNFSQGQSSINMASTTAPRQAARGPRMPMSPPVSPMTKDSIPDEAASTPSSQVKDPILYPRDESAQSPPQQPLFPSSELIEHRRIVDEHIAARSAALFRVGSPPPREHYELALHFKSQVMKHFTDNRKAWLRKERELLVADRKAGAQRFQHRFPAILPARPTKPTTLARVKAAPKTDRVVKPQPAKPQGPRVIRTNPAPARQVIRVSATPEPSRRIVAPNREDRDYGSLPDYCPPLNSLPDKPNSLKVDWKGAPIDLSGDPNAHLLHADEISLAANLRLDCATYLTSKRRIFVRRLECARVGKEFRKTDAQQACKIDVNKASKLWTAFDKVGWLDLKWMRQFA